MSYRGPNDIKGPIQRGDAVYLYCIQLKSFASTVNNQELDYGSPLSFFKGKPIKFYIYQHDMNNTDKYIRPNERFILTTTKGGVTTSNCGDFGCKVLSINNNTKNAELIRGGNLSSAVGIKLTKYKNPKKTT